MPDRNDDTAAAPAAPGLAPLVGVPACATVVAMPPASILYRCDHPSRSDHQNRSWSSLVTYQLVGFPEGGPISTKVLDESRATTRTEPVVASTTPRYALLEPRVNQVT